MPSGGVNGEAISMDGRTDGWMEGGCIREAVKGEVEE